MININSKKSQIEKLAKKREIKFVVLFGSQAKGVPRKNSDFDIAVYMDKFSDLDKYSDALFELAKIFGVSEDKIDLTDLKNADPLLRYEITSKGKLLYGDELDYLNLKAFSFRDYISAKHLMDLEYFLIKKKQKLFANLLNL